MSVKIIVHTKRIIIVGILRDVFVRMVSIFDDSVTGCDEIIYVMVIVLTNVVNAICYEYYVNKFC